jgi:hypothetical protein
MGYVRMAVNFSVRAKHRYYVETYECVHAILLKTTKRDWNCIYMSSMKTGRKNVRFEVFTAVIYEECCLLGYKTPVCTSQETHYFSATESSQ